MPGLDGYEAIRRIRVTNANVPIVVISAFSLKVEEQKDMDAGCNGFISKPFNPENVVKRINAIVAK